MKNNTQNVNDVSFLTEEYSSIVENCESSDNDILTERLVKEADWTDNGATELVYLAKRYGSFVLRNALALSIALGIEDGEAGI